MPHPNMSPRRNAAGRYTPLSLWLYHYTTDFAATTNHRRSYAVTQTRLPFPAAICGDPECDTTLDSYNTIGACRQHVRRCYNCDRSVARWTVTEAVYSYDTVPFCADCAATCISECDASGCETLIYSGYFIQGDSPDVQFRVCRACLQTRTARCNNTECSVTYFSDVLHVCVRRPRRWDFRPEFTVFRRGNTDDYAPSFGVELECGLRGVHAGAIEDLATDFLYVKTDGSVETNDGDSGIEVITQPFTMDWFRNSFPFGLIDYVAANGGTNSTCGGHIHMGADAIDGNDHLAALLYLWNGNVEHIRRVCGRISERYARPMPIDQVEGLVNNTTYADRYSLVNVMNLRGALGTVEFRGFSSFDTAQALRMSIEMVAASVEFTREHRGIAGIDWEEFGNFVFTNGEAYPHLVEEWFARGVHEVPVPVYALQVNEQGTPVAPRRLTWYERVQAEEARRAASATEARRAAASRRYRDESGRFARRPANVPVALPMPVVADAPLADWERELLGLASEVNTLAAERNALRDLGRMIRPSENTWQALANNPDYSDGIPAEALGNGYSLDASAGEQTRFEAERVRGVITAVNGNIITVLPDDALWNADTIDILVQPLGNLPGMVDGLTISGPGIGSMSRNEQDTFLASVGLPVARPSGLDARSAELARIRDFAIEYRGDCNCPACVEFEREYPGEALAIRNGAEARDIFSRQVLPTYGGTMVQVDWDSF